MRTETAYQIPPASNNVPDAYHRDMILDGFRAYAVIAVIIGHAMAYRFSEYFESLGFFGQQLRNLSGPIADFGVYIFFTISGYIITLLLIREDKRDGKISLSAFYLRRSLRILPPLLFFLLALFILNYVNVIDTPAWNLPRAFFVCNLSLFQCDWYIAHTWSLAVEEQFYLGWPIIFLLSAVRDRWRFAAAGLIVLLIVYGFSSWTFHSNSLSFASIAAGACIALCPELRERLAARCGTIIWLLAGTLAVLGPALIGNWLTGMFMPLLVAILIFGAYGIEWLRPVLTNWPVQQIGAMSYSLYLWQQLFLGSDAPGPTSSVLLLVVIATLSLYFIERPFIKLSRWLSRAHTKN